LLAKLATNTPSTSWPFSVATGPEHSISSRTAIFKPSADSPHAWRRTATGPCSTKRSGGPNALQPRQRHGVSLGPQQLAQLSAPVRQTVDPGGGAEEVVVVDDLAMNRGAQWAMAAATRGSFNSV